jgi:hypothetical protein
LSILVAYAGGIAEHGSQAAKSVRVRDFHVHYTKNSDFLSSLNFLFELWHMSSGAGTPHPKKRNVFIIIVLLQTTKLSDVICLNEGFLHFFSKRSSFSQVQ